MVKMKNNIILNEPVPKCDHLEIPIWNIKLNEYKEILNE